MKSAYLLAMLVLLVMTTAGCATANRAPIIHDVGRPAEVKPGETVILAALASDPDDDELTYTWETLDGGKFIFRDQQSRVSVSYQAPQEPGEYYFRLTVSDGSLNDSEEFPIIVSSEQLASQIIPITIIPPPPITILPTLTPAHTVTPAPISLDVQVLVRQLPEIGSSDPLALFVVVSRGATGLTGLAKDNFRLAVLDLPQSLINEVCDFEIIDVGERPPAHFITVAPVGSDSCQWVAGEFILSVTVSDGADTGRGIAQFSVGESLPVTTPTPEHCVVTITEPKDGSEVPMEVTVRGVANAACQGGPNLWVVVEIGGRQWPQLAPLTLFPRSDSADLGWFAVAHIGQPDDLEKAFGILVISTTPEIDEEFFDWFTSGEQTGQYPGFIPGDLAKRGTEVKAGISVTRR